MSWVKKGAGRVVGIYFSPKAIEAARRALQGASDSGRIRRMRRRRRGRRPPAHVRRGVLLLRRPLLARRSATVGGQRRAIGRAGRTLLPGRVPQVRLGAGRRRDRRSPGDGLSLLASPGPSNHFASGTDYIDLSATTPPHYTWNHGLGPVVTALLERGVVLEFLDEMPYCASAITPMLKVRSDGYYGIPGMDGFGFVLPPCATPGLIFR